MANFEKAQVSKDGLPNATGETGLARQETQGRIGSRPSVRRRVGGEATPVAVREGGEYLDFLFLAVLTAMTESIYGYDWKFVEFN